MNDNTGDARDNQQEMNFLRIRTVQPEDERSMKDYYFSMDDDDLGSSVVGPAI